jgi:DNA helicase-2/ATP-dependent DNA helicase PcrA
VPTHQATPTAPQEAVEASSPAVKAPPNPQTEGLPGPPSVDLIHGGEFADTPGTQERVSALLQELNPQQRQAVTYPPQPLLVIAGAGTGKTRALTYRVAYFLITGQARPEEILAITFTNKAAREMQTRLRKLCGPAAERINIGTFHATCARMLRAHPDLVGRSARFSIYDNGDSRRVIERALSSTDRAKLSASDVQREISANKNQGVTVEAYDACAVDPSSRIVARAWLQYEHELTRADAIDLDDLLCRAVKLLSDHPGLRAGYQQRWKAVLVDEYQDSNPAQARLLRLLIATDDDQRNPTVVGTGHRNLTVVGDDRQAIYSFRQAAVWLILDFDSDYLDAGVVTLEENYRSTPQILDPANRLIGHNKAQRAQTLRPHEPHKDGPDPIVHSFSSEEDEARWIALQLRRAVQKGIPERDIAVLARAGKVVEPIEHALAAAGISYQLLGGQGFFARREIKTVLAHLRLLINPRDEVAFARAIEIRPKVANGTIAKLIDHSETHRLNLLEAAAGAEMIRGLPSREARDNVVRFGRDMLALAARAPQRSVSSLTQEVIHMPGGAADALTRAPVEDEQTMERVEALRDAARTYERQHDQATLQQWLQDAALAGQDLDAPDDGQGRVTVGSIHAIKGLEWPTVIGAGIEAEIMPSRHANSVERLEEERRMFYVLLTRPRRVCVLCYSLTRNGRPSGPSPFVAEALGPHAVSTRIEWRKP